jgi:hypothetical protein
VTGKNSTPLVGWHPSGDLLAWLEAEVGRRGGGRGVRSAILEESLDAYRDAMESSCGPPGFNGAVNDPGPHVRKGLSCQHDLYRLSCEEFEALRRRADGKCEICRIPEAETPRGLLCIDHDGRYSWWAVRGLLCDKCNALMSRIDNGERKGDPRATAYYLNAWFLRVIKNRGDAVQERSPDLSRQEIAVSAVVKELLRRWLAGEIAIAEDTLQ